MRGIVRLGILGTFADLVTHGALPESAPLPGVVSVNRLGVGPGMTMSSLVTHGLWSPPPIVSGSGQVVGAADLVVNGLVVILSPRALAIGAGSAPASGVVASPGSGVVSGSALLAGLASVAVQGSGSVVGGADSAGIGSADVYGDGTATGTATVNATGTTFSRDPVVNLPTVVVVLDDGRRWVVIEE